MTQRLPIMKQHDKQGRVRRRERSLVGCGERRLVRKQVVQDFVGIEKRKAGWYQTGQETAREAE